MSASIQTLKDLSDNTIYPQSLVRAIYDDSGNPLPAKLSEIDNEIALIKSSFEVTLRADEWVLISEANPANIPQYDDYVYACRKTVTNMLSEYNPKLFTNYISTTQAGKIQEERALALIKDIITADSYIIAYAYQKPNANVHLVLAL